MQKPCRIREPGEFGACATGPHQREAPGTPPCPTVVRGDPSSIAMASPLRTPFPSTAPSQAPPAAPPAACSSAEGPYIRDTVALQGGRVQRTVAVE
jgi:hypothetical protein